VQRQPVESSNIRSIGYENGKLEVEFHSGKVYQYDNVPPDLADRFVTSSSKGSFFARNIRPHFTGHTK